MKSVTKQDIQKLESQIIELKGDIRDLKKILLSIQVLKEEKENQKELQDIEKKLA